MCLFVFHKKDNVIAFIYYILFLLRRKKYKYSICLCLSIYTANFKVWAEFAPDESELILNKLSFFFFLLQENYFSSTYH